MRVLNNIEQLQGANATFDAPLPYVRANEAEVRHALDTAARWRNHFTFATSMHSAPSSVVESVLRCVPPLWRFVSIGLLGAFDGVPDADRRAASMQRQFFGDAQARTVDSGPVIDACRTGDRRTAAQSSVHLRTQTVFLNESSHSATLEIYEVYENVGTCWSDDIRYNFRVPAGAQVTNLYLGSSADRSKRTPSTMEPSSLAERIYTDETKMHRDPALLELTAPQTYRLRVAPIVKREETHVWIEVALLVTDDDVWTLPTMLERRHLFWNQQTSRRACVRPLDSDAKPAAVDAASVAGDKRANDRLAAAWRNVQHMARIAADDQCDAALQQLERNSDDDGAQSSTVHINALDSSQCAVAARRARPSRRDVVAPLANSTVHGTVRVSPRNGAPLDALRGRRVAIAVDRSAAMRAHGAQVRQRLGAASNAGAQVDVLLLAAPSRTEAPIVLPLDEALGANDLIIAGDFSALES